MPDISQIWFDGKIQFKKDEYIFENGSKYIVEGEWLNGVPHGICIVENHEGRGVLVFTHGNPNGAPGWAELKNEPIIMSMEKTSEAGNKGIIRLYKNLKNTDDDEKENKTIK